VEYASKLEVARVAAEAFDVFANLSTASKSEVKIRD
jgi:hypothetical protein